MPPRKKKPKTPKSVETIKHEADKRKNIPTAEHQSLMKDDDQQPIELKYPRNTDLDPQLVWRGKDDQDWSDLVVKAPPLFIQEKVHPKVLIDDLLRQTEEARSEEQGFQPDLFSDFNGVPSGAETDFYQHEANWSNRIILGDSLQVMASLAEREGLRGKVQCIYFDPPYGIKFNSNFQWSTTSRDVKDGKGEHITREPEQVKAFRDTWRDGVHSYLTYLRDRLTVARDLLADSGAVVVQIGDENIHRIRALMDEVFGPENFVTLIAFKKTTAQTSSYLAGALDYLVVYSKELPKLKYRQLYLEKSLGGVGGGEYRYALDERLRERRLSREEFSGDVAAEGRVYATHPLTSQRPPGDFPVRFRGQSFRPRTGYWKTGEIGFERLIWADRVLPSGSILKYRRFIDDFSAMPVANYWDDVSSGASSTDPKVYVVQTVKRVVQRCLLMLSDPGDLVLDPTCGSGTTAVVAEEWGRRWITVDTSRVALALTRARLMGSRFAYYLLSDSASGRRQQAELSGTADHDDRPPTGDVRQGFVYSRIPRITLKAIANNAEIEVIWETWQGKLSVLREELNAELGQAWEEWEIPHEPKQGWSAKARDLHEEWWAARIDRQKEIDASIRSKAEFEYLYDKPYVDNKKVRVAGPFTVESLSPHRTLGVDENDELVDTSREAGIGYGPRQSFPEMILDNLKTAGVQQAHKDDRITFTSLAAWPGELVCGEGHYQEGDDDKRAAIFIGAEFGTVQRADLVKAAREAADAGFDVLVSCAFNYEAHTTEFNSLGKLPVLKARMNADLHMAEDLKKTSSANLFVVFGEPDIDILDAEDGKIQVKVNGVDVFKPQSGEVVSDGADGIACWFIDSDYNEESFFVRHAYFLGAGDPYKSLKTTLKAEIDEAAWQTLHSDTSRPFDKPAGGRIAVKVINHLGDEVMKVFKV